MTQTKGYTYADYEAAVVKHGSIHAAAKALGLNPSTMDRNLKKARHRANVRADMDPGITKAAAGSGIEDAAKLHSGWVKGETGSFYFMNPKPEADVADITDRILTALEDIPRATPTAAPKISNADLLTVYPIADAHLGMRAWRGETGEDYDTKIASRRICAWIGRVVEAAPPSDTAIILDVGDMLHADDQTNQTPSSHHQLDTDTRYFKTIDVAIWTLVQAIDTALTKHRKVIVSILRGNHDPHAYLALLFALAAHYRDEPRVTVQKKPGDFFIYEFGECLIASQHGDKAGAQKLVMFVADQWSQLWGRTKFRYLFTGHLHHHKSADIGGMVWEQLSAVTSKDYYAFSHAFAGRPQLSGITYHRDEGVKYRTFVNA
jgi:hypothetical protein